MGWSSQTLIRSSTPRPTTSTRLICQGFGFVASLATPPTQREASRTSNSCVRKRWLRPPYVDAMKSFVAEIAGLALYILFVQYVLADFVFEKPNEAWIRIGWH